LPQTAVQLRNASTTTTTTKIQAFKTASSCRSVVHPTNLGATTDADAVATADWATVGRLELAGQLEQANYRAEFKCPCTAVAFVDTEWSGEPGGEKV